MEDSMYLKEMYAKYNGTCQGCGCKIRRGDRIVWSQTTGAMHTSCRPTGKTTNQGYVPSVEDLNYWRRRHLDAKDTVYGAQLTEQWRRNFGKEFL